MRIAMIPFGLLSGFMDSKEIRITELGEDGFRFRLAEECPEPEQFLICFYDMKKAGYRRVEIRRFGMSAAEEQCLQDQQPVEKKTGKYKRFPINSKLKPMFAQFTQGRKADEPLFLSVFNNRMERTQCYRIINDICRKAGIDYNIGTHTLRKTFGYHHYRKFKDIVVLQKIFNHYSPQVTLRYIGIDQDIIDNSYNNFIL